MKKLVKWICRCDIYPWWSKL